MFFSFILGKIINLSNDVLDFLCCTKTKTASGLQCTCRYIQMPEISELKWEKWMCSLLKETVSLWGILKSWWDGQN